MKIEVETLNDGCIGCPYIWIENDTIWSNDEVYINIFRCKELDKCKVIAERLKDVSEQE